MHADPSPNDYMSDQWLHPISIETHSVKSADKYARVQCAKPPKKSSSFKFIYLTERGGDESQPPA